MQSDAQIALATEILEILPNPVLVKDQNLEYVWINSAFEELFSVKREDVVGKLDKELFPNRQVSQCNGGDLRVLDSGDIDEAVETVFEKTGLPRETITRKSRLVLPDNSVYLVGVMHDITEVTRANEALTYSQGLLEEKTIALAELAMTDALTGCSNRRALEQLDMTQVSNESLSVALFIMDIDKFKLINDTFGHDCGDAVLTHFSDLIRTELSPSDFFIRLGGEEFAVSMTALSKEKAEERANKIRKIVERSSFVYQGKIVPFTISIGVAYKQKSTQSDITQLLKIADDQLYLAKTSGRNKVVIAA